MRTRTLALTVVLALTLVLTGCATSEPEPDVVVPPVDGGAAGLRLAPGLYDLEEGKVQALGTLEYQDLEGGLWAIIDGTEGGGVVAVIANADEFAADLVTLTGKSVLATGTRLEGASIRMAGPEIVVETIEEISDTPGIAE